MNRESYTFVRMDGLTVDAVANLSFDFDGEGDPIEALKKGVSDWISDNDDGYQCWKDSARDLNIGDLLAFSDDAGTLDSTLLPYLKRYGITRVHAQSIEISCDQLPYDTLLIDDPENFPDEED